MKKIVISIFLSLLIFSCSEKEKERVIQNKLKQTCLKNIDKKEVLLAILSNPRVDKYLHLEIPERNPVKILSNNYFNQNIKFEFDKIDIVFIDNYDQYKDVLKINLTKIDCNKNVHEFSFFSKIEGSHIEGKLIKNGGKWEVLIALEGEN